MLVLCVDVPGKEYLTVVVRRAFQESVSDIRSHPVTNRHDLDSEQKESCSACRAPVDRSHAQMHNRNKLAHDLGNKLSFSPNKISRDLVSNTHALPMHIRSLVFATNVLQEFQP